MYEKVKKIITDNYNLSKKDIETATQDIIERCFVITGVPKDEELFDYIAEYLDRYGGQYYGNRWNFRCSTDDYWYV